MNIDLTPAEFMSLTAQSPDFVALTQKVNAMAATEAEVEAKIATLVTGINTLKSMVSALQTQVANGQPVTQVQLEAINSALDAAITDEVPPVPPVVPVP